MKIPERKNTIKNLIDAYYESLNEPLRPHLGCSVVGHPCERYIWIIFRWVVTPKHKPRIKRLFQRGKEEEARVVRQMRSSGVDVRSTGNNQETVDLGCHVGGSIDGIIHHGVPIAPNKKHILEIKTHSLKSFNDLEKNGVEKSKPEHFIQMQLYMHGMKIDRAIYFAVCKDNDETHEERIKYDKDIAEKYIKKGHKIALLDNIPEKISNDPSWYQCKICPANEFCHQAKLTKNVNCRTCAHVTAKEYGTWSCERYDYDNIPVDNQRIGCESHVIHPDMVPWERKETQDRWQATYIIEGKEVVNGEACASVYASHELIAGKTLCADEKFNELREFFDSRIIGSVPRETLDEQC